MAADRDVQPREQEREQQVDEDRRPEPGLHRVDPPRVEDDDARAHQPEHRAGRADRVAVRAREQDRAECAGQQRGEVDGAEAQLAEARLEHLPEDPQQVHVEADVEEAERALRVQEAAGERPPDVAVGDRAGGQHEVEVAVAAAARAEEQHDVDPDQHVGQDRRAVHRRHRPHLRLLARALRAAHADRGRRHAVATDGPPAVRARDARLAVRVAVAGGHAGRATLAVP